MWVVQWQCHLHHNRLNGAYETDASHGSSLAERPVHGNREHGWRGGTV